MVPIWRRSASPEERTGAAEQGGDDSDDYGGMQRSRHTHPGNDPDPHRQGNVDQDRNQPCLQVVQEDPPAVGRRSLDPKALQGREIVHMGVVRGGRVAAGGCPPAAPTDPGVPNSGTRLVRQGSLLNGTHCAQPAQAGGDRYG